MRPRGLIAGSIVLLVASVVVLAMNVYQMAASASGLSGEAETRLQQERPTPAGPIAIRINEQSRLRELQEEASEVRSQVESWMSHLLGSPGWLHMREQVLQNAIELGLLPDGEPVPDDFISDNWYFIDAGGMATAAASVMYDLEGSIVQESTYERGVWTNLTFDFSFAGQDFAPVLDHGISQAVAALASGDISSFERRELETSRGRAVEVSTYEIFPSPIIFPDFSGRVERIVNRGILDAETGALLSYETILISVEGQETVITSVQLLTVERADLPPGSIMALFQEVPR